MWAYLSVLVQAPTTLGGLRRLNVEVFFTLEDVREKLSRWQEYYSLLRPHSSLHDQAPVSYTAGWSEAAKGIEVPCP